MQKRNLVISVFVVIAVVFAIIFFSSPNPGTDNNNQGGNNSNGVDISGWQTFSDDTNAVYFKYPADLGTEYISLVDWPPKVQILGSDFTCTEAGTETGRAGITQEETINGKTYCVTKESGGAAGSVYTNYAYVAKIQNTFASFTFSTRSVQCANYDAPKRGACEEERQKFDINPTIDALIRTATVPNSEFPKISYFNATADNIILDTPRPGATVTQHFLVSGQARGTWFFEASFPVNILDSSGQVILAVPAQASGEWMTPNFVPFNVDITLPDGFSGPATLVLQKDNPSDMRDKDASISLPINVQ